MEEKLDAARKEVELKTLEAQLWEDAEKASVSPATFTANACVTDNADVLGDQQKKEVHFTGVPGRASTPSDMHLHSHMPIPQVVSPNTGNYGNSDVLNPRAAEFSLQHGVVGSGFQDPGTSDFPNQDAGVFFGINMTKGQVASKISMFKMLMSLLMTISSGLRQSLEDNRNQSFRGPGIASLPDSNPNLTLYRDWTKLLLGLRSSTPSTKA